MAEARCEGCGIDTSNWAEMDRLQHLNSCLDDKLKPLIEEMAELNAFAIAPGSTPMHSSPTVSTTDNIDLTGMPNYAEMSKIQLQTELDKLGIKKLTDSAEARTTLQEIWVYCKYTIWPKSLQEYL